jgi:hypothetical protein
MAPECVIEWHRPRRHLLAAYCFVVAGCLAVMPGCHEKKAKAADPSAPAAPADGIWMSLPKELPPEVF